MAPDVDQDGKMINPHNPDFITKVPWYLGNSGPTLKHHNIQKSDHFLSLTESDQLIYQKLEAQRKVSEGREQKVFKKGSCKNCGATTHKEKDCVERPRSVWDPVSAHHSDNTVHRTHHSFLTIPSHHSVWLSLIIAPPHCSLLSFLLISLLTDQRRSQPSRPVWISHQMKSCWSSRNTGRCPSQRREINGKVCYWSYMFVFYCVLKSPKCPPVMPMHCFY